MRQTWLLLPLLLLGAPTARADGGPEQAAVAGASVPARARLQQQLHAHDAEVARLEQQVAAQESHSRRASERLGEQDREIARLQRQLEALRSRQAASGAGR